MNTATQTFGLQPLRARAQDVGVDPGPDIQQALARTTSALCWFPALIAARNGGVIAIDVKDVMPSTLSDRYALSVTAVQTA
ncbi:hypothetical protein [Streptomyces sp. NPDC048603]|uniref:hypothetical protein n=1 Tax=Streptomyces sp. NPDC048603 TaxID=3365577 RepID=UPI003719793C